MEFAKNKTWNGLDIPAIGYGTGVVRRYSKNKPLFLRNYIRPVLSSIKHMKLNKQLYSDLYMDKIVRKAYDVGFRMFDSGRIYAYSEPMIGKGLAGISRSDYWMTSKVSDMDLSRQGSPNDVEGNLQDTLRYMRTDKLDAYLLHWPSGPWKDIYHQMEDVYQQGLTKTIGVCNCTVKDLQELSKEWKIKPMFNQLELNPFYSRRDVRDYCQENGIIVMAHTPTFRMGGRIGECSVLSMLAHKYDKSIAQIILRWHYQNGVIPLVATTSPVHMLENLSIFDFELTESDMESIEGLNEDHSLFTSVGIDDPNYIYNL
ncbi:aldo/keto reductase family protein [Selenomonas montiformis]|uniref:aldo/keto reductase family protein n=1 Tax=Selenomonas montiformis TaxID=2652285 RepID=UPI0039F53690